MGGALTSRLRPGERCATLAIKINHLAPVSEGRLAAEAQVVERTTRVAVLEAKGPRWRPDRSRHRHVLYPDPRL